MQLFGEKKVRSVWDEEQEKWYFSILDVCGVLTDSKDYQTARKYWNKLKERLKKEGNESVTNCHQLKLEASDGKKYKTDVADTQQLFRLIQYQAGGSGWPFRHLQGKGLILSKDMQNAVVQAERDLDAGKCLTESAFKERFAKWL